MSSTLEETDAPDQTHRHMTTLLLEERPNGEWVVTQGGVAIEGEGETAAEAAADYCQQIDDGDE